MRNLRDRVEEAEGIPAAVEASAVRDLKAWFDAYVDTFRDGGGMDENMVLKADHTRRVCGEIVDLGRALGLDDSGLRLAEILALFHDVGRFEQYARYGHFVDRRSEDHAALGVRVLEQYELLGGFPEGVRDLILWAVAHHNRAALPEEETAPRLFFTRLLRDADKLDIWRVVTEYYRRDGEERNEAIELGLPDTPSISGPVMRDLREGRIVDAAHIRTLNDFKLLQVGWVFDLNFRPALEAARSRGYLGMIRDALPDTEEVRGLFEAVDRLIQAPDEDA